MSEWLSLSTEALLVAIIVMLYFINNSINLLIKKLNKDIAQPMYQQMRELTEQVSYLKWHTDQIRQQLKYGKSDDEINLNSLEGEKES